MKQKFIIAGTVALMLSSVTLTSFATDNSVNDYARFYGAAAQPSSANRTITIGPDTIYVNVTQGDVVKFVDGDKTFTWNFDVTGKMWQMDLSKIAPPGMLSHAVKVYIEENHLNGGN